MGLIVRVGYNFTGENMIDFNSFIDAKNVHTAEEYKKFVADMNHELGISETQFFKEGDLYVAPASTKFHGHFAGGLILHSLLIFKHLNELNEKMGYGYKLQDLWLSALYHDACKVNLYKVSYKNAKDINGNWTKQPYYTTRTDYKGLGHGVESMVIYLRDFAGSPLYNEEVRDAIRWHMGFSDLSPMDQFNYDAFLDNSKLVLLINTADQMAAHWDGV